MICKKPFKQGVMEFGCGQCLPCRINRRRLWSARLVLEATQHEHSLFLTLTYSPEYLPHSVEVRHGQLFLKRLRERIKPLRVRYYLVGEYGDLTGRPHYHVALYGTRDVDAIRAAWPYGHVHVGQITEHSAAYVVGYLCKGMTKEEDARLNGRKPEFARMSLKPGIGAGAVPALAAGTLSYSGAKFVSATGDVPGVVRFAGRKLPLGRYLKRKLREEVGMPPETPELVVQLAAYELQQKLLKDGRESRERVRTVEEKRAISKWYRSQSKKGVGL